MAAFPSRAALRAVLAAVLLVPLMARPAGFEEMARRFAESDFVFNRARSDIPFVPLAWADVSVYERSRFLLPSGDASDVSFQQRTLSEATLIPVLLGNRDALVLGQWMSMTRFDLSTGDDKDVFSVALPMGWARQASPDWQFAAFVAPLGYSSEHDGWYWEYMGGIFARWLQSDHFVWLFGFYADVAPLEEYYIPYVGLTWTINQQWTLSAVMPWPALLYAPSPDWLVRLGVSPSDASWSARTGENNEVQQPQLNFGSWNLGISAERRIWRNLWLGAEAGVAGLRGFSFAGSDW
ncbi:MAG TPA: hypothetical protein VKB34_13460, partial [Povalibacter sp.]|nr:hypothetical protein [Povalibacter sp.]